MNTIKFYQVGGSVRDHYLGVTSKDIDYAVEASSFDAMREAIIKRGGKIFLETPQYFTIRAHVPALGATNYTLCRKDGEYKDGRHPESVTMGTIYDDLARRDFTMNAIAIDMDTREYIDPFKGQDDIMHSVIRCVGSARARFDEDKLRMFRAVRFAITKSMRLDHEISNAIGAYAPMQFDGVSTERIRDELYKMFARDTIRSFRMLFNDYPLLGEIVQKRGLWFKPTTENKSK